MSDETIGELLRRLLPDEEEAIRAAPSILPMSEPKPRKAVSAPANQDHRWEFARALAGLPPGAAGFAQAYQLGWRPSLDDPATRFVLSLTPPGALWDAYEGGRESLRSFNEGNLGAGSLHAGAALLSAFGAVPAVRFLTKGLGHGLEIARNAASELTAAHPLAYWGPAAAQAGGIAPDFAFMSRGDLPMDPASRLGRAKDGYRVQRPIWRGDRGPARRGFGDGVTFSSRKADAAKYGTPTPYVVDKNARVFDAGKPVNGSDLSAIVAAAFSKDWELAQQLVDLAETGGRKLTVKEFLGYAEMHPNLPMAPGQRIIDAIEASPRATSLILADAGYDFAQFGNKWVTTSGNRPARHLRNLNEAAFDPTRRNSPNVFDALPYALLGAPSGALHFTHSTDDR